MQAARTLSEESEIHSDEVIPSLSLISGTSDNVTVRFIKLLRPDWSFDTLSRSNPRPVAAYCWADCRDAHTTHGAPSRLVPACRSLEAGTVGMRHLWRSYHEAQPDGRLGRSASQIRIGSDHRRPSYTSSGEPSRHSKMGPLLPETARSSLGPGPAGLSSALGAP
jgi:hypothetical protein